MPETSLSGRNTRIARSVRRSISTFMPCGNAVMNLPQTYTHPRPHFTTYYSITLIHYLSTTDKLATSVYLSLLFFIAKTNFLVSNEKRHIASYDFSRFILWINNVPISIYISGRKYGFHKMLSAKKCIDFTKY